MPQSAWELGEFGLIDRIRERFPEIDLTDDCAVIPHDKKRAMLVSTDTAVCGVHFPEDEIYFRFAGARALAGSASDINASGGKLTGALLALNIPKNLSLEGFECFIDGIEQSSRRFDVPLLGGNIARSTQFSATLTVFGDAQRVVPRSGARPGDILFVSGDLGGSELGRLTLYGELPKSSYSEKLIERFLQPLPPFGLGPILAERGASSMIDISDGLLADLGHIAKESEVKIAISAEKIPLAEGMIETLGELGAIETALFSGEEYQLAFTMPPSASIENLGFRISRIGQISTGLGIEVRHRGKIIEIKKTGWRHF